MKIQFQYKNLSKSEQASFDSYIALKLPQIEALLVNFEDDTTSLDVKIEKFDKHDAFDVELLLSVPMKTIKSKEASHSIMKAVDLSKDRLVAQFKKFKTQTKTEQMTARKHASIRGPDMHEEVKSIEIFDEVEA